MAFYELLPEKVCQSSYICISSYETVENVTKYRIMITIGKFHWTVSRRYSDFYDLNDKLSSSKIIDRNLLPPKKLFGNQQESFINQRKADLEKYLKTIFKLNPIPPELVTFLEFDKYEIRFIIESLAAYVWENGDNLLLSGEGFHLAPLQCHALTELLKLPKTSGLKNAKTDIGHILDFLSKLSKLLICGSQTPVGSSNIIPNQLPFSMILFKSLQNLKLVGCDPQMLNGLTNLRKSLKKVQIQDSLTSLKDFLLADTLHWDPKNILDDFYWVDISEADFSYNQLTNIDDSIFVLQHVQVLDLSHNQISVIEHLERSSYLTVLDLSFNRFTNVSDELHTKLGNIVSLRLTDNNIESLKGFRKLYSLVELNVKNNRISAITEINNLINLPCLENLTLLGNPITNIVDYRTRVLEQFNSKVAEICLDNHLPTLKEIDTINILQALRKAKETSVVTQSQHDSDALTKGKMVAKRVADAELEAFKQQVLSIRNQGGTDWLRLWNQRQRNSPQVSKMQPKPSIDDETTVKTSDSSRILPFDSNDNTSDDVIRELILPDWLPDSSNKDFLATLDAQLSEALKQTPTTDELYATANSRNLRNYFWVVILWCPSFIRCFKFPACFVILDSCLVIFLLNDIDSDNRFTLLPFRCINAKCLSSVNIGFHSHFIRFEERSVSDVNEYALLLTDASDCKACAASLARISALKIEIDHFEANSKLYQSAQFYAWVAADSESYRKTDGSVTCLAVNGTQIGLLQEQICNFAFSDDHRIKVVKTWNAKLDLVNLQMHSNQEMNVRATNLSVNVHASSAISPAFTVTNQVKKLLIKMGYGITISFRDQNTLSVRFANRETRDRFLDALTLARA